MLTFDNFHYEDDGDGDGDHTGGFKVSPCCGEVEVECTLNR